MKIEEFIVDKEPIRIDVFLKNNLADFSRNKIIFLIKNNSVSVNGKKVIKQSYFLKINDVVQIDLVEEKKIFKINILKNPPKLNIIKETKDYLILNKPHNLIVHFGKGKNKYTLVDLLLSHKFQLSNLHTNRPGIVHRLDKNTTGVMVIAKNDKFQLYLQEQFKEQKVDKVYLGLVNGLMPSRTGIIEAPIGRSIHNRKLMVVTSLNSKKAITKFKVIERLGDLDLVEFNIITGRTHQIRVHLKYINLAIYNDKKYGKEVSSEWGNFLHSKQITFRDLENNEVSYSAELPKYFQDKLKDTKQ